MTTIFVFHEVMDGEKWAKAWTKEIGSRHELFGKLGIKCQTFRDPQNPKGPECLLRYPTWRNSRLSLPPRKDRRPWRRTA